MTSTMSVCLCALAKKVVWPILAASVLLLISWPAFPQANQGTIQGSVFDQTGGAIAGATVTVIDVARGVSRPLTTDSAGAYVAPNLIPGSYTVRGAASGFQVIEHANVIVGVGQTVRVDLVLQPGQQTQTVTVTSEAAAINTSDVTLGGAIDNQEVSELPMNGRDFKSFLNLRPGVVSNGLAGTNSNAANGSRGEDVGYLVDGLRADEAYTGNPAINSPVPNGDSATIFPFDAIQEMNMEENPKAEFGWRPGAIVNVGLKSGANSLHGDAFAFGRDDALDARNFFNTYPAQKPPITFEQFGGSAGGRIKKDKLFWFGAYEDQRYTVGNTSGATTPGTVLLPGGNTAANVAASLVNACLDLQAKKTPITPLSAQIAGLNTTTCAVAPTNYTPGPGESMFPTNATGTTTAFLNLLDTSWSHNGLGKIDYHINDHNTINGMFFYGVGEGLFSNGSTAGVPGSSTSPFQAQDGPTSIQLYSGAWNWVPSSTRVNELRIGYDHFYQVYQSVDHTVNPLNYGINTGVTDPRIYGFPTVTITGFAVVLGGGQQKIVGPDGSLQLLDHFTIVRGNHTFKFGGEFIDNKATSYQNATGKGSIKFGSLETFLTGSVSSTGSSIFAGNPTRNLTNLEYAFFGQDDWRVSRRTTLNLGLRWEYSSPLSEANNQLGNFSPTLGLEQVGKQISSPYNGDFKDFEPRVGVAWDISGNGKTVLRVGASLMYSLLPMQTFIANEQALGIGNNPTGATIVTQGACAAGCPGSGSISVVSVPVPGPVLTTSWQNQTAACVTGGTTACGPVFPASVFNIQCGDGIGKDPSPCLTAAVDPNLTNGYIATWTLGIQRAVTNDLTLDVGYIGTHGGNLAGYFDINQAKLGSGFAGLPSVCSSNALSNAACGDPSTVNTTLEQQSRPYFTKFPYLSYIDELENADRSNYDSLQVTATQRAWHRWNFLAGYTFSHALDDVSTSTFIFTPVNSNQQQQMYGNSDFDIQHSFTFSTTYLLPGKKSPGQLLEGWQVNSVLTLRTALPWTAQDTSNDFSGNGEVSNDGNVAYGQFWNFSGNRSDFSNLQPTQFPCWRGSSKVALPSSCTLATEPQQCINAASAISANTLAALNQVGCYVVGNSVMIPPALGTDGNATRGIFRGTNYRNLDMSINKNWKLKERFSAQFRAEFFNILNHPNFFNIYSSGKKGSDNTNVPDKANFGCACFTPDQTGDLVVGAGGARAIQLGLKLTF